jgi:putative SOS response-associated peptidase YedK
LDGFKKSKTLTQKEKYNMSHYLKKSLFFFIMLTSPCVNLSSKAMYEDLVKEEIRITTRLSKIEGCVYSKNGSAQKPFSKVGQTCTYKTENPSKLLCDYHDRHLILELQTKLTATQKGLKPFRDKEEDEALLRKLQIAKAQAELNIIQAKK